jgi:hypothetical protein
MAEDKCNAMNGSWKLQRCFGAPHPGSLSGTLSIGFVCCGT